jgi:hypothetical protein
MMVSYNTAKSAIDALIEAGLVEQLGDQARNRAFLCRPLFDLLFYGSSAIERS